MPSTNDSVVSDLNLLWVSVDNFPHMLWLEAVGATLVIPGDYRSGIASVVIFITLDVYHGQ